MTPIVMAAATLTASVNYKTITTDGPLTYPTEHRVRRGVSRVQTMK